MKGDSNAFNSSTWMVMNGEKKAVSESERLDLSHFFRKKWGKFSQDVEFHV